MKTCNRCHVNILDDATICPLCKSVLCEKDGIPGEPTYPDTESNLRSFTIFKRIILFFSIVAGVVSILINYFFYNGVLWSLITTAAIIYFWAAIIFAVKNHANLASKILVQAICASALLVVIDYVIGYTGWAVNYVVPNILSLANIVVLIVIIVNRLDWHNYVIYQIMIGLLGFVPVILYMMNVIHFPIIPIISAGISLASLAGTMIFGEKTVRSELKRRFHF